MEQSKELTKPPVHQLPKLADLISDTELAFQRDDLNIILNTPVPDKWVKKHPMVKVKVFDANGQEQMIPLPYVPIRRVKLLLTKIFGTYQWSIKEVKQLLNSVVVTGTITVRNPITGEYESQDGVGAAPIQMDKGATQGDLTAIKSNAIQIGAPAAESYAIKNAAEKFGDIFGGNLIDVDQTSYTRVYDTETRAAKVAERVHVKKEAIKKDGKKVELA